MIVNPNDRLPTIHVIHGSAHDNYFDREVYQNVFDEEYYKK